MPRTRLGLTVLLLVTASMSVFAETENWIYGGFEYSKAYETQQPGGIVVHSSMDSIGANLSGFTFWNRGNIGLYVHDSFLFPKSGTVTANGQTYSADLTTYDFLTEIGLIIGPGFRYTFGQAGALYGGLGLHGMEMVGRNSQYVSGYGTVDYSLSSFNIGVGTDVGLKVDLGSTVALVGGVSVVYDPINYTSTSSNYLGSTQQWSSNYSLVAVDPYLGIGINFYRSDTTVGKPK